MSDPLTIKPTLPSGAGAPSPFNANDAMVWKALVCKYFCKNRIETFNRDDFYETFLAGRLEAGDAYIPSLKNGSDEDRKLFEKLLNFSIDSLTEIGLLSRISKDTSGTVYKKTHRLDIFCDDIMKYAMFDVYWLVNPILEAEREIIADPNCSKIVALLQTLKKVGHIKAQEINRIIDYSTITKLSQLGIIFTPLEGSIIITSIGTKVLSVMSKSSNLKD